MDVVLLAKIMGLPVRLVEVDETEYENMNIDGVFVSFSTFNNECKDKNAIYINEYEINDMRIELFLIAYHIADYIRCESCEEQACSFAVESLDLETLKLAKEIYNKHVEYHNIQKDRPKIRKIK